VMAAIAGGV